MTYIVNNIYQPIHKNFTEVYSGEGDAITYPFLVLLLFLIFFLLNRRMQGNHKGVQAIVYFFLIYAFLWLILGSGVSWYGLLILPLGILFIGKGINNRWSMMPILKFSSLLIGIIWISSAMAYRFASYSLPLKQEAIEKGAKQSEYNLSLIHI